MRRWLRAYTAPNDTTDTPVSTRPMGPPTRRRSATTIAVAPAAPVSIFLPLPGALMPPHATSHASRDASSSATKCTWLRRCVQYVSIAVLRNPSYEEYAGVGLPVLSSAMRATYHSRAPGGGARADVTEQPGAGQSMSPCL